MTKFSILVKAKVGSSKIVASAVIQDTFQLEYMHFLDVV